MPGKDIGYIRVSTHDQNTARQLDGVHLDKVFEEHASRKNSGRPALQTCLDYVRDGDVLYVRSIDRLARNLQDLLSIITAPKEKGVTVTFHKEKLEFIGNGPLSNFYMSSGFVLIRLFVLKCSHKSACSIKGSVPLYL
ncbi:recombinase family protein [Bilophila wadsworthia]|uniref:recombinase family protein n=1 Tax=Bilophila wadsworthia TaxID=35833 RepID=UPI003D6E90B5